MFHGGNFSQFFDFDFDLVGQLKMQRLKCFLAVGMLWFLGILSVEARAEFVILSAVKDNTLYESSTGALSNGAGDFLFSGRTEVTQNAVIRRGLIQFDLSSIPAGSTIDAVALTLNMNRAVIAGTVNVNLHRVSRDWGEGASNAAGQEGGGASTTPGDATWIHAVSPGTLWTTQGGDFVATVSASRELNPNGSYTWQSASLSSDVTQWVNNSSTNFGWMIRGDETAAGTAMRYNSRASATAGPSLRVDFTAVPEPSSMSLGAVFAAVFFLVGRRRIR